MSSPTSTRATPATRESASKRTLGPVLDGESRAWLQRLRAGHPDHDRAVSELHALLVKAARFEISRRRAAAPHLRGGDWEDLAQQSAGDALVAILAKLDGFRGESRFTTWAYKFALYDAAVKMRRLAWQGRELPQAPEGLARLGDRRASDRDAPDDAGELLGAIGAAIAAELSERQREVLVAVALNGVPIDVLAERLGSTRGALYKTLHDARVKLRRALAEDGLDPSEVLAG